MIEDQVDFNGFGSPDGTTPSNESTPADQGVNAPETPNGGGAEDADARFQALIKAKQDEVRKRQDIERRTRELEEELGRIKPQWEKYEQAKPYIQQDYNRMREMAQAYDELRGRALTLEQIVARAKEAGVELPDEGTIQRDLEMRSLVSELRNLPNQTREMISREMEDLRRSQEAEKLRAERESQIRAEAEFSAKFEQDWVNILKVAPDLAANEAEWAEIAKRTKKPVSELVAPLLRNAEASKAKAISKVSENNKGLPRTITSPGSPGTSQPTSNLPAGMRSLKENFKILRERGLTG